MMDGRSEHHCDEGKGMLVIGDSYGRQQLSLSSSCHTTRLATDPTSRSPAVHGRRTLRRPPSPPAPHSPHIPHEAGEASLTRIPMSGEIQIRTMDSTRLFTALECLATDTRTPRGNASLKKSHCATVGQGKLNSLDPTEPTSIRGASLQNGSLALP